MLIAPNRQRRFRHAQIFRYELWSQGITTWNRDSEAAYAALFAGIARYYALPAPSPAAIGWLIQEGARRADGLNRDRLTVDLLVLHDIIIEAGKAARLRTATTIAGEDVDAILNQRRALQHANIFWVQSGILAGESITPTTGTTIGQINGLGVFGGASSGRYVRRAHAYQRDGRPCQGRAVAGY